MCFTIIFSFYPQTALQHNSILQMNEMESKKVKPLVQAGSVAALRFRSRFI